MKVKEESEKVGLKLNIVSRGLLSSCGAWASHCSGFSCGAQALGTQASVTAAHGFNSCSSWPVKHRISSCDAQAQLLCGMWNLPRPGIKLLPPALAGRFLITGPPGKSDRIFLCILFYLFIYGYAGSSLLHRLFSSCGKQGTRSSCRARASHRSGSSCC